MTNNLKLRGYTAAALAATMLFAAQPAKADVIEINDFWAGAGEVNISFTGTDWHDGSKVVGLNEPGGSGGFKTYDLSTDPNKQNAFQSFCVDIFSSFSFVVESYDTLQPASVISSSAAVDLARLYTNHHDLIDSTSSSADNESAFQLAVWEIVNEGGDNTYNLASGGFRASGTGSSIAQTWLDELERTNSVSTYSANIWTVQGMKSGDGYAQDVVVFSPVAPVPEPQTYAMMLVGLGLLGFSARRKNQNIG
jgi:hypothetical protein